MIEITQLLNELGANTLDLFWLPVAIWTVFALLAVFAFKVCSNLSAIYHYHLRVALLAALPAGILASPLFKALFEPTSELSYAAIFVFQSPIPIVATPVGQASINWFDPALWLGIAALTVLIVAFIAIIKLLINFIQVQTFARNLDGANQFEVITDKRNIDKNVKVFFSDKIEIPCTFGWFRKCIVLPSSIRSEHEKCNMALRHELMHIRNHDYMLNTLLQSIKALFWFHPLVHLFVNQAVEYREIYCDQSVLADSSISQKKYARLLFELAPKPLFRSTAAVSMAVTQSTLKKRIQVMKTQTNILPSLKRSFVVMFVIGLTLTGIMACSDITDDGTTVAEIENLQEESRTLHAIDNENQPLFVVNGEVLNDEQRKKTSYIQPKYIKSMEVLKGEAATDAYGEAGKNGVIKIQLINEEKAFSDLKPSPPVPSSAAVPNTRSNPTHQNPPPPPEKLYIAVDNMPKLINSRSEIQSHVEYPKSCVEAGVEGTVIVQFVVTKTGNLTDFDVIQGVGGCDQAAVEAIKNYAEFTPGEQDGKPVNVRMSFPIVFSLQ